MNLARFFLELGVLKRTPRSGWLLAGIQKPESVADHGFRTAIIAWVLAEMEKADADKAIKMALLHDLHEARTGDPNMLMKRYGKIDKMQANKDILNESNISDSVSLLEELEKGESKEAIIIKDADQLELFLQTVEYEVDGFAEGDKWKHSAIKGLKTESAKNLVKEIEKQDMTWWYQKE